MRGNLRRIIGLQLLEDIGHAIEAIALLFQLCSAILLCVIFQLIRSSPRIICGTSHAFCGTAELTCHGVAQSVICFFSCLLRLLLCAVFSFAIRLDRVRRFVGGCNHFCQLIQQILADFSFRRCTRLLFSKSGRSRCLRLRTKFGGHCGQLALDLFQLFIDLRLLFAQFLTFIVLLRTFTILFLFRVCIDGWHIRSNWYINRFGQCFGSLSQLLLRLFDTILRSCKISLSQLANRIIQRL